MDDSGPPCKVCGYKDLNLVDGYYYCVECGTQDQTIRETVVEYTTREDGTNYITKIKKFTINTQREDLSPEWYKWHAYNLMMAGFADELVSLGAGEEFKLRLLWIWSKYVCSRRVDEAGRTAADVRNEIEGNDSGSEEEKNRRVPKTINKSYKLRGRVNMSVMQAMLYAALNASHSDIQSGDLRRFIKEERISCRNCLRFLPEDFDYKKVDPNERILTTACVDATSETIRGLAMTVYKEFDLGVPRAADLHRLVDRYVTELLLPDDFRQLAFSLMEFIPVTCDLTFGVGGVPRIPNYEGVAMAYVIVALKICFGLDDVCENELSDMAERYNQLHEFPKAYKHTLFEVETGRLFSFREWVAHLQYRTKIISKYYFPVALDSNEEIDARAFMSHAKNRHKHKSAIDVADDVMMEILGRIPADIETFMTPKVYFPPSLTPMATYTEVLLPKIHDPVQKELLGEDFSQYSLKYITGDLQISDKPFSGVNSENFVIISRNASYLFSQQRRKWKNEKKLIYVRHFDNEDWMKTKDPKPKHVRTSEEYASNNESNTSNTEDENEDFKPLHSRFGESTLSETEDNIFDDIFDVLESDDWSAVKDTPFDLKVIRSNEASSSRVNYSFDNEQSVNFEHLQESLPSPRMETFDRNAAIELLVQEVIKEYKINTGVPKSKRKMFVPTDYNNEPRPKRARKKSNDREPSARKRAYTRPGDVMREVKIIKDLYYSILKDKEALAVMARTEERSDVGTPIESIEPEVITNDSQEINEYQTNQQEEETIATLEETKRTAEKNVVAVKNVESSDSEYEIVDGGTALQINDNFDREKYDTRQLYLKVKPYAEENSVNGEADETMIADSEITDLVRKKEKEILYADEAANHQKENSPKSHEVHENEITYEEIAISELMARLKQKSENFREYDEMDSKDKFRPYKYWIVSYEGCSGIKQYRSGVTDKELDKCFPRSFAWVFKMCSRVIQSDTRSLYMQLMNLEDDLKCVLPRNNM